MLLAGLLLFAAVNLASGLASALAISPSPSPSGERIVLKVGWLADPKNLNPFVFAPASASEIRLLNYDSLVGLDAATLTPLKGAKSTGLATDWSVSPDGKTWTFTLRDDAAWQDGRGPVTAQDVAFTYNYVIDNDLEAFSTYTQGVERVIAVDDHTARFECARPKADMLTAAWSLPILPEHVWSSVTPQEAASTFSNGPPIVGSGPFKCVEFKRNAYVRMVANKQYWRGAPKIDEILFDFYTNRDTMVWDLEAGRIDACYQLDFLQLRKLQKTQGITARTVRVRAYDDLVVNSYTPGPDGKSLGNPVLRDPRFRQALQWAIDRDKLAQVVYNGLAQPGETVIPADYFTDPDWHWTPPAGRAYTFSLERAGQALDVAGYLDTDGDGVREDGGEPIRLRLWAASDYPPSQPDVRLIAFWLRQVGLKIDVETIPMATMYDRIFNMEGDSLAPDFDLCQSGWYLGLDPGENLSFFTTDQIGGWNDSGFSNAELDRLFVEQGSALDVTRRKQLTDRMQQIVYEQSPYIVLVYVIEAEAWSDEWVGWIPSPARVGSAVLPDTVDSYLFVHPRSEKSPAPVSGFARLTLPLLLAAVAAVTATAILLRRRRSRRRVEE
jgi:peptide/nickel transport system substrate-binding protein